MTRHESINYIELPAKNLSATKQFFKTVFNWQFTDYGEDYAAFSSDRAGIDGGFFQSDISAQTQSSSALIIFYSDDIKLTQEKITQAGGRIVKPIFDFPGGRRFHFCDPSDNEWAVWGLPEA